MFKNFFPKTVNRSMETYEVMQQQPDRGQFECHKCGSAYKHRHHMYRHMKHECGVEPKFHCPYCPKRYRQKCYLRIHVLKNHQ